MELIPILNRCHRFRGFVYQHAGRAPRRTLSTAQPDYLSDRFLPGPPLPGHRFIGSDAYAAACSLFDFVPDRNSIGPFPKAYDRQKNNLLELTKVLRHICST
jgi:hypothetical protein